MQVDSNIVYNGWFGNRMSAKFGTGTVYVGGLPSNLQIALQVPTRRSLQMDIEHFLINRM